MLFRSLMRAEHKLDRTIEAALFLEDVMESGKSGEKKIKSIVKKEREGCWGGFLDTMGNKFILK